MTSYFGPDNPSPLSLISENYQRCLDVSVVSNNDNALFNLGDDYYIKLVKLLRLQAGINIDDQICVVASRKSKIPMELEKRMCLMHPVLHLTIGTPLYEDSPGRERELNVGVVPINAETYFRNKIYKNTFDKIIITDGLEKIEDRFTFLENAKSILKNISDNALILFHRTREILTLPVYIEVLNSFEEQQIETQVLMDQLVELDFLVGWNIVSLPIQIPKTKWFNQLYNYYPAIMESVSTTDIYSGLRELVETSFKYSDFLVTLKDRFLFIVATINDSYSGHQPYKMHLFDEDLVISSPVPSQPTVDSLLRLTITPEIRNKLPKNIETMERYLDNENQYPEEWWGTMPSASMGNLDKSRINHKINMTN